MKGVINSEIDVNRLSFPELSKALKEPDYLIALFQNHAFNSYKYDLDGEWDHIPPGEYKKFISGELQILENQIWAALEQFQTNMRDFKAGR